MQYATDRLLFSPSDLVVYLDGNFPSWMDRWYTERRNGNVRSITQGDFYTEYFSACRYLLAPLWLLPAERPIGRVGFAPTGDRRLARRTG